MNNHIFLNITNFQKHKNDFIVSYIMNFKNIIIILLLFIYY